MVCIIKSVSIDQVENDFLKDYKLSPSQLLKEKIWEMRGMVQTMAGNKLKTLQDHIIKQSDEIERLTNLLKENGILEKE